MAGNGSDTVTEIVDSCIVYWFSAGVPRSQAEPMAAELRSHLEQAVAEGKSPRDVVGDDIARFAEEWRRAVWQPRPWYAGVLSVGHILAAAALIVLLPALWRPSWILEVGHLAQVLWLAIGISILFSPRFGGRWLANSADRPQARLWITVLLVTFGGHVLLSPALPVMPQWILVRMERWQVLLAALLCVAVSVLAIALDPTRPRRKPTMK